MSTGSLATAGLLKRYWHKPFGCGRFLGYRSFGGGKVEVTVIRRHELVKDSERKYRNKRTAQTYEDKREEELEIQLPLN